MLQRGTRRLLACSGATSAPAQFRCSHDLRQNQFQFPLPLGSVAVWWMDPEKVPRSYVEKYAHWLTTTELRFICGAGDPLEEHTRLCSRILLRSALATCLGQGLQLSDFKFRPGKHGKPLLVTDGLPRRVRDYDFNLTNTRGLIGLAVAAGARVGIDCERLDRKFTYTVEKIAARMYSSAEREELQGIEDGPARVRRFVEKWVQKEALVKATGRGLAEYSTRMFSVVRSAQQSNSVEHLLESSGLRIEDPPGQLSVASSVPDDVESSFAMVQCLPTREHVGAVCLEFPREGGSQQRSWAGVGVRMFDGFPGDPEALTPASSPLIAAT